MTAAFRLSHFKWGRLFKLSSYLARTCSFLRVFRQAAAIARQSGEGAVFTAVASRCRGRFRSDMQMRKAFFLLFWHVHVCNNAKFKKKAIFTATCVTFVIKRITERFLRNEWIYRRPNYHKDELWQFLSLSMSRWLSLRLLCHVFILRTLSLFHVSFPSSLGFELSQNCQAETKFGGRLIFLSNGLKTKAKKKNIPAHIFIWVHARCCVLRRGKQNINAILNGHKLTEHSKQLSLKWT